MDLTGAQSDDIEEALNDLIRSIAEEEKAIAQLLYEEAKKIRAAIEAPDVTPGDLIKVNCSVENTIAEIVSLEIILAAKLRAALRRCKCSLA